MIKQNSFTSSLLPSAPTAHGELLQWIDEVAELCLPDAVY
jgi:GTP-dependent phosphoenolpyruvate carboxykinase